MERIRREYWGGQRLSIWTWNRNIRNCRNIKSWGGNKGQKWKKWVKKLKICFQSFERRQGQKSSKSSYLQTFRLSRMCTIRVLWQTACLMFKWLIRRIHPQKIRIWTRADWRLKLLIRLDMRSINLATKISIKTRILININVSVGNLRM